MLGSYPPETSVGELGQEVRRVSCNSVLRYCWLSLGSNYLLRIGWIWNLWRIVEDHSMISMFFGKKIVRRL